MEKRKMLWMIIQFKIQGIKNWNKHVLLSVALISTIHYITEMIPTHCGMSCHVAWHVFIHSANTT